MDPEQRARAMRKLPSGRQDFTGNRTLIVGPAREGTALARFLAERGAHVTVTDTKPAEALAENIEALAGLPVAFGLGGHRPALLDRVDIVFVSPGVPLEIPFLLEARRRGLSLSSETRLFTRLCPAPVVGITGSSGKTTTTALVGEMLRGNGYRTWVGGNIGWPLIGHLEEISSTDVVVMELSSFQLEFFAPWSSDGADGKVDRSPTALFDRAGWSPPVAAVLNITPNHLDRHDTMEAYIVAKSHILAYQKPGDVAVLNLDNPESRRMAKKIEGRQRVVQFSLEQEVEVGAFLHGDTVTLRLNGRTQEICHVGELRLLGRHNLANVLAACALAGVAGASREALRLGATTFSGVEHRLELVRERDGVRWYNDSIATTPERTVAALRAFPNDPVVLLAGGRDKHLPWEEMADLTWKQARHLILFGEAAGLIEKAMDNSPFLVQGFCQIHRAGTLERAVEIAAQVARPGDVVLLSPGGTSFDSYRDFAARGKHFRELVKTFGES